MARARLAGSEGSGAGPARLGNLPAPISSFVGREREIAEVSRLLQRARLLTLTGAGGVGKSRLALEVASHERERWRDGTWLVELATVTDDRLLWQAVAATLRLREQPGQSLPDTVIAFLRLRDVLLILDNCEHLAQAVSGLAGTLLRACPSLRILATSRSPLRAATETLWRVPSLSLPATDWHGAADAAQSEAIRLFVERAQAARHDLALTEGQAPVLVEICRRLDGIPLALELAAAMTTALTVEQVARRLDDRFALLASGPRAGLPRHRTLRALVDWSYDLAAEPERTLLHRLGVFAGGWTLEAAEAVCDGGVRNEGRGASDPVGPSSLAPPLSPLSARAALIRLVAASLVMTDGARGDARFHLLETIREYALEKLRASGEEPLLRQRHLDWVVELADRAEPLLWTAEQKTWMARLDRELPNIRAALAWSLESKRAELGLRIACGVWHFWELRGQLAEARRWLGALLAATDGQPTVARARALGYAAYFAYLQGDREAAAPLADEALKLARAVDDLLAIVTALFYDAILAKAAGDFQRAETCLQEALERSRKDGLERGVRVALMIMGETARMRGADQAVPLLEQSLALADAAGDGYSKGYTLMSLGHLRLRQGDLTAAQRWLGRALAVWHDLEDVHILPHALEGLAWTAAAAGEAERAACLLGAASALREAIGGTVHPQWRAAHERATDTTRAALGERAFAAVWQRGRAMSYEQVVAYALEDDAQPGPLTPREREIAVSIAEGHGNREIAAALGLSERTVEWHVSNLLDKLRVPTRTGIVTWALERGLVGDAPPPTADRPATGQDRAAHPGPTPPGPPAPAAGVTPRPVLAALPPRSPASALTEREREIAGQIAKGRTAREIAEILHVSRRTVEWHVRNVLAKLGVRSRAQLVRHLVTDGSPDGRPFLADQRRIQPSR